MRRRRYITRGAAIVAAGIVSSGAACTGSEDRVLGSGATPDDETKALVAGSLAALADEIPNGIVEAHGSAAVRQLLVQELRDPDVVALADPQLFVGLADRVQLFATNALTLAYDPDSSHSTAIEADWRHALDCGDCLVGRSDPETDPLGYRTVLGMRLAERAGLIDDAVAALADTMIQPEVKLMRVLGRGKLDAAFVYRNMAVEHDLPHVDLPARIDFSTPRFGDVYRSVSYDLGTQIIRGGPIRYAVHARTPAGERWAARLVSNAARLRDSGFGVPRDYPQPITPE